MWSTGVVKWPLRSTGPQCVQLALPPRIQLASWVPQQGQ